MIYRGLIQEHLRRALGSRWSLVLSGVVFWVLHWIYFGHVTFPNHLVGGWVIAWSYDRTRSLLAPTLLHAVGNLLKNVVAKATAHGQESQRRQRRRIRLVGIEIGGDLPTVELDQSKVGRLSRMDALQAQAMSVASNRRREMQLQRIAKALIRIENDEFGRCDECDTAIARKRLEFDPSVTLCIECAQKKEI